MSNNEETINLKDIYKLMVEINTKLDILLRDRANNTITTSPYTPTIPNIPSDPPYPNWPIITWGTTTTTVTTPDATADTPNKENV